MGLLNVYRDHLAKTTIGEAVTPFDNANAYIGVGNSTTAYATTQTDLVGASKTRKGMEAGYPQRSANALTFRAVFGTGDANHAWNEWIVANASIAGTAMNRKVESLGTKTNAEIKTFTATITLGV